MKRMFLKIIQWGRRIYVTFAIVAAVLVLVMMLITVLDVSGRTLFNAPLKGAIDFTTQLLVASVLMSLVFIQYQKKHIAIDFLVNKISPKARHIMELASLVVSFVVTSFIAWRCLLDMVMSWQTGEATMGVMELPYAPLRSIVFLGFFLLGVCLFIQISERFRESNAKT